MAETKTKLADSDEVVYGSREAPIGEQPKVTLPPKKK